MAKVTLKDVTRVHPGIDVPSVDRLSLDIEDGEFVVLVGPSGCGKSTSLRMVAGLEDVTAGTVTLGDRDITGMPPKKRDIAMVFQNYALYPHMTVADNMGYALKIAGVSKSDRIAKVKQAATLLDLEPYLGRKPKALSGGQRQRVAMGRAIVREPQAFLMDEPLSNLDAKLRAQTRTQIAALQRRLGTTTIYVTHDQVEALTMADRIAILRDGVLQQFDTPRQMYSRPANAFVAAFIGSPQMNIIDAALIGERIHAGGYDIPVSRGQVGAAAADGSGRVQIGIRSDDVDISSDGMAFTVTSVEELGADAYLYGRVGNDTDFFDINVRVDGHNPPRIGERLHITLDPERLHIFSSATGERL